MALTPLEKSVYMSAPGIFGILLILAAAVVTVITKKLGVPQTAEVTATAQLQTIVMICSGLICSALYCLCAILVKNAEGRDQKPQGKN